MKAQKILLWSLFIFVGLLYTGCDPDDPEDPGAGETELITDVSLSLVPVGGGDAVEMTFQDRDGDGGNAPVIVGGTLDANTTYNASISFFDRSDADDEENITEEIEEEDDEHQVFYQPSGINITFSYDDQDSENRPLGLETTMVTGAASTGTLTVTLRHEPDKDAAGVSDGDITNAGGETDIEVAFPVTIQ